MFDWNEDEFTNIIWGEAGESDDHIVPYPESTEGYSKKREWNQESETIKSNKQKVLGLDIDIHCRKLGDRSTFEPCKGTSSSGFHMDSWPKLSLSNDANACQHSLNHWVSEESTEFTTLDSLGAKAAWINKDSGFLENSKGGEDQGDLVDYGWEGSFDDLDRIFSYDSSMFSNVNLGNPDEIWSSSKDISNGTVKSFVDSPSFGFGTLQDSSQNFEIKAEHLLEDDHAFTLGFGEDNSISHLPSACAASNASDFVGGESKRMVKDQKDGINGEKGIQADCQLKAEYAVVQDTPRHKACKQNKFLKYQKKNEEEELKSNQEFYGNWSSCGELSGPCRTQIAPAVVQLSPSSVVSHQMQLHGAEPLLYQHFCNPVVPPATPGNNSNSYSAVPVLSQIPMREHQSLLSGCDVYSGATKPLPINKRADSPRQLQIMTPQEKIEKLRRRQQMQADSPRQLQNMTPQEKIEKLRRRQRIRAMLAIQKQQQQLGQQVSCSDPSITQCSQENQFHHIDGINLEVEELSTPQTFGPRVPIEQDVSSTTSLEVDDYSAEDAILYHLQDVVSKLDVRVRLCMRNSLFRLAQSAVQRHFASDNNSTNKTSTDDQLVSKGEDNSRDTQMLEVETETNPVDRTVAHLLFHRPIASSGKHPHTPDSPDSPPSVTLLSAQHMAKSSVVCSPTSLKDKHGSSFLGSGTSSLLSDPQSINQGKTSACIDTTSNRGPTDDETRGIKASRQKDELLSSMEGQDMSERGC